jgi:osmotically-inducible protein OsmY
LIQINTLLRKLAMIEVSAWKMIMPSELELRQCVLDELTFEPAVNASHIGVAVRASEVNNEKVRLGGKASSWKERDAAERIACSISGVGEITNRIEINRP